MVMGLPKRGVFSSIIPGRTIAEGSVSLSPQIGDEQIRREANPSNLQSNAQWHRERISQRGAELQLHQEVSAHVRIASYIRCRMCGIYIGPNYQEEEIYLYPSPKGCSLLLIICGSCAHYAKRARNLPDHLRLVGPMDWPKLSHRTQLEIKTGVDMAYLLVWCLLFRPREFLLLLQKQCASAPITAATSPIHGSRDGLTISVQAQREPVPLAPTQHNRDSHLTGAAHISPMTRQLIEEQNRFRLPAPIVGVQ